MALFSVCKKCGSMLPAEQVENKIYLKSEGKEVEVCQYCFENLVNELHNANLLLE